MDSETLTQCRFNNGTEKDFQHFSKTLKKLSCFVNNGFVTFWLLFGKVQCRVPILRLLQPATKNKEHFKLRSDVRIRSFGAMFVKLQLFELNFTLLQAFCRDVDCSGVD